MTNCNSWTAYCIQNSDIWNIYVHFQQVHVYVLYCIIFCFIAIIQFYNKYALNILKYKFPEPNTSFQILLWDLKQFVRLGLYYIMKKIKSIAQIWLLLQVPQNFSSYFQNTIKQVRKNIQDKLQDMKSPLLSSSPILLWSH